MGRDVKQELEQKLALDREVFCRQIRFNYAWNWFDFHARQRTTMFNFFVVATGIFFAAYASLVKVRIDHSGSLPCAATTILLFLGASVSLLFFLLDFRNAALVDLAEELLERMECDNVFFQDDMFLVRGRDENLSNEKGPYFGLLTRERYLSSPRQKGSANRVGHMWFTKHGFVIRAIELIACAAFVALLVNDRLTAWKTAPTCGTESQESREAGVITKGTRDDSTTSNTNRHSTAEESAASTQ